MFTTPEHRTIVAMLAAGSPVWYVAAVTKSDRHYVYTVGAQHGYPNRAAMRQSLQHMAGPRRPAGRGDRQPARRAAQAAATA
jgi:uncharacterized membrane protein